MISSFYQLVVLAVVQVWWEPRLYWVCFHKEGYFKQVRQKSKTWENTFTKYSNSAQGNSWPSAITLLHFSITEVQNPTNKIIVVFATVDHKYGVS